MGQTGKDEFGGALVAPLLSHISDGVFVVDRERRICLFNPAAAKITGVGPDEAVGMTCHDLFTGSEKGVECAISRKRPCTVRAVFDTGRPVSPDDAVVTFPGGNEKTLRLNVVPLFDGSGEVARAAVILSDVSELHALRRELVGRYDFHNIIGRNHRMREIYTLIEQTAGTDATVLVEGESGTGKELVARAIHFRSARSKKPFVQVNCSALVETLLESELFGHARGAFTGAVRDKIGRFEAANGGTIFLDEIGDVSPAMQVKLLRVIQERQFERVGENKPRTTDVRIIAATNHDLKALIAGGVFREDLYYRLAVVRIHVPPLRERREDIPLLVDAFRERFRKRMGRNITSVAENALARMMDHNWPGNVRELENAIEHAFVRCGGDKIEERDLPAELRAGPVARADSAEPAPASHVAGSGTLRPAEDEERSIILAALNAAGGNKALAAKRLGIGRTTLWRRMQKLGIVLPKYPDSVSS